MEIKLEMLDAPLRHLSPQDLRRIRLVAHKFVVDVSADALFVDRESLHRELHAVERRRLPDKVGAKIVRAVDGDAIGATKFESDLV